MGRPVLYLRPRPVQGNGVRAYSDRVMEAFRRYGDGRYLLVDASEELRHAETGPDALSRRLGERIADAVAREAAQLVFAEMGVGEFEVFHALRGLKAAAPGTPTLVTVHDPPRTVVNLDPRFHPHQGLTAVRGARWLYNRSLGRGIERDFLAQGHHWLLLSEQGRRLWSERVGAAAGSISVLPHMNYCDLAYLPPPLQGEGRGGDGVIRPLRLGVLGCITRSKGIDLLIDALDLLARRRRLPEGLAVEIAGTPLFRQDQRYFAELRRQVARTAVREQVTFSGYLPEEGLPAFFSGIDLLVLPYRETGSGSASGPLMWAKSCGVPVVATRTRNIPEMVHDGEDGILCAPGDCDSLANALEAAWQAPRLARLREGAKARREECSWKVCVARLTSLFDRTIAG